MGGPSAMDQIFTYHRIQRRSPRSRTPAEFDAWRAGRADTETANGREHNESLWSARARFPRESKGTWNPTTSLPQWQVPGEVSLPHVFARPTSQSPVAMPRARPRRYAPTSASPSVIKTRSANVLAATPSPVRTAQRETGGVLRPVERAPSAPPDLNASRLDSSLTEATSPLPGILPIVSSAMANSEKKLPRSSYDLNNSKGSDTGALYLSRGSNTSALGRNTDTGPASLNTSLASTKANPLTRSQQAARAIEQSGMADATRKDVSQNLNEDIIKTADDVIAYYAIHGENAKVSCFYLNPIRNGCGVLTDVVVVPVHKVGSEHFIFRHTGVVTIRHSGTPEETSSFETTQEWYQSIISIRFLLQIPFFQNIRQVKAFRAWKDYVHWNRYCRARLNFVRSSFIFQTAIRTAVQEVWELCLEYQSVALFRSCAKAGTFFTPDNFKNAQRMQRIKAVVHYQETMKKVKDAVLRGCTALKKQLAARNVYRENQELRRQQTDLAFRKGASRSLPIVEDLPVDEQPLDGDSLRNACVSSWDESVFARFIWTCHFMITETAIALGKETMAAIEQEFGRPPPDRNPVILVTLEQQSNGKIQMEQSEEQVKKMVGGLLKEALYSLATQQSLFKLSKLRKLVVRRNHLGDKVTTKPISVLDVLPASAEYQRIAKDVDDHLMQDYLAAPGLVTLYAKMEGLERHLDEGKFRAIAAQKTGMTEALFREKLVFGQDMLKVLDRIKTTQQCGVLALSCRQIKSALYERVYAEIQFVKDTILEFMWSRCVLSLTELNDLTRSLKKTPSRLSEYVNYVTMFNAANLEARPRLYSVQQEVLSLRQMCNRFQVVMSAQLLVKLDDFPVASLHFKSLLQECEETVIDAYRKDFIQVLENKVDKLVAVIANARTELMEPGVFDNAGLAPTTVIAKLNFFRDGIAEKVDKLEAHSNYQRALGLPEHDLRTELETLGLVDRLLRMWRLQAIWTNYHANILQEYVLRLEHDRLAAMYIYFNQRLAVIMEESATHTVCRALAKARQDWDSRVPILMTVTNPHWDIPEWEKLFKTFAFPFSTDTPFTIQDLEKRSFFDLEILEYVDAEMLEHEADSARWRGALDAALVRAHREFHGRAILGLVNDEQVARLTSSLSELHFVDVNVVTDGEQLLAALGAQDAVYDLVIADIALPRHGALELGELIRSTSKDGICNPGIPIFALPETELDDDGMVQLATACATATVNLVLSPAKLNPQDLITDLQAHVTGWAQRHKAILK